MKASQVAMNKFERTMKRKGFDLSVVSSYKVWSYEQDQGHGTKDNVWTRIDFELPKKRDIYVFVMFMAAIESLLAITPNLEKVNPLFQL